MAAMIVDDRLETVLRTNAAGRLAMRIQFRQLADLLGRSADTVWGAPQQAALDRLDAHADALGEEDGATLLRSCALRSPRLVRHFADRFADTAPRMALAAITGARLDEAQWIALVPALPVQARGFLRHRRDLGDSVEALLARLGIDDFALPCPTTEVGTIAAADPHVALRMPAQPTTPMPAPDRTGGPEREGIGAIVRRIEAFRRHREAHAVPRSVPDHAPADAPTFVERAEPGVARITSAIDIRIDAEGMIVAADTAHAPMLVGHRPFTGEVDAPATCDATTLRAFRARQPVEAGLMTFEGTAPVAGSWRVDAVPAFARDSGHYTGYHARLRRPETVRATAPAANDDDGAFHQPMPGEGDSNADRLRQLLHELRTPINAIQGFAELIQQQLFGPTPHQYRSLAASIASDAARMLAGFEDVEQLVRLETAPAARGEGETDLAAVVARLVTQLEPAIGPREVRLRLDLPDHPLPVAVDAQELERTLWRMLSVIAGAAAPGERLTIALGEGRGYAHLVLPLPAALAMRDDAALFAPDGKTGGTNPAQAMLGNGFALRLAAAEVRAVGGHLARKGARLLVDLPLTAALRPLAGPAVPRGVGGAA